MMLKRVALCAMTLGALSALAACSGSGVDETAATTTYNARYVGAAVFAPLPLDPGFDPVGETATLSLSQLASTVTGTVAVFTPFGQADTVFAAGVTGHTTPTGLHLTVVRPVGCVTHLTGPLTLQADGSLNGTLLGADCRATGQNDVRLTLSLAHP